MIRPLYDGVTILNIPLRASESMLRRVGPETSLVIVTHSWYPKISNNTLPTDFQHSHVLKLRRSGKLCHVKNQNS